MARGAAHLITFELPPDPAQRANLRSACGGAGARAAAGVLLVPGGRQGRCCGPGAPSPRPPSGRTLDTRSGALQPLQRRSFR